MSKVFIGLGGNIGNVQETFVKVIAIVEEKIGSVINQSSLYKTAPWGFKDQNDFLNKVICVNTNLSPADVLKNLLTIELMMGRNRNADNKNAPRTIDLDILFYDDKIIADDNLVVPHPRLHLRNFVLGPLAEIAPNYIHPVILKKIKEIAAESSDTSVVKKI